MPSADVVKFTEECFKGLTGSEKIDYRFLYPGLGKGVQKDGCQKGVFYRATLARQFSKKSENEQAPSGSMSSLRFYTADLNAGPPHPNVTTKIDLYDADTPYVEERIRRALNAQKLMKELIGEDLDYLTGADNLPFNYLRVDNLGNKGFSLYINKHDKKGKSPKLPVSLVKKIGDMSFERSKVEASIGIKKEFEEVVPALDFQIEKFGKLV